MAMTGTWYVIAVVEELLIKSIPAMVGVRGAENSQPCMSQAPLNTFKLHTMVTNSSKARMSLSYTRIQQTGCTWPTNARRLAGRNAVKRLPLHLIGDRLRSSALWVLRPVGVVSNHDSQWIIIL